MTSILKNKSERKKPARKKAEGKRSGAKSGTSNASLIMSSKGSVVPACTKAVLRFAFNGTASPSTGYSEFISSGTNLFDPSGAGGSQQPVGFDELALWYNSYRVNKCDIELTAYMSSTSATPTATAMGANVVLYPNSSASSVTLLTSAQSQAGAKSCVLTLGSHERVRHSGTYKTVLGLAPHGFDSTVSSTGGGPSVGWNWHLGYTADAAYTGVLLEFQILYTYHCEFFSRKLLEVSTFENEMKRYLLDHQSDWMASGEGTDLKDREGGRADDEKSDNGFHLTSAPLKEHQLAPFKVPLQSVSLTPSSNLKPFFKK